MHPMYLASCGITSLMFCPWLLQTETASVDADIQKEYARQREHLERSVASLRKKLSKDTEIHRADNVRIMQVNHGAVLKFSIDQVIL